MRHIPLDKLPREPAEVEEQPAVPWCFGEAFLEMDVHGLQRNNQLFGQYGPLFPFCLQNVLEK